MPYIKKEDRKRVYGGYLATTPGELNYAITVLCQQYWSVTGNYQGINDIVGALEGAKMEFYRRVAATYENKKIVENGDVY